MPASSRDFRVSVTRPFASCWSPAGGLSRRTRRREKVPAGAVCLTNRNHDLAARVAGGNVPHRLGGFFERVGAVDDRSYATAFNQFAQHIQVGEIRARDERNQLSPSERFP